MPPTYRHFSLECALTLALIRIITGPYFVKTKDNVLGWGLTLSVLDLILVNVMTFSDIRTSIPISLNDITTGVIPKQPVWYHCCNAGVSRAVS